MTATYTITFDELTRSQWDGALAATPAPYQQDWAYGEVISRTGTKLRRAAICDGAGELCGLAQIILRPFAVVATFALSTYGPVWLKPMSDEDRIAGLKALRKAMKLRWPRLFALTIDDKVRPPGFSRIMTGDATVYLDLTQDEAELRAGLDRRWRNHLSSAEKSELKFTASGLKPGQYQWLLDKEMEQRKAKGYRGLPPQMTTLWQEEKARAKGADRRSGLQVWRTDLGREPAAAMLFLIHGAMATYHMGWNSEDGRKHAAHNLILWKAILELKSRGVKRLDLGGVNTQSGAGIARFKFGTGGEVFQRAGTFV